MIAQSMADDFSARIRQLQHTNSLHRQGERANLVLIAKYFPRPLRKGELRKASRETEAERASAAMSPRERWFEQKGYFAYANIGIAADDLLEELEVLGELALIVEALPERQRQAIRAAFGFDDGHEQDDRGVARCLSGVSYGPSQARKTIDAAMRNLRRAFGLHDMDAAQNAPESTKMDRMMAL